MKTARDSERISPCNSKTNVSAGGFEKSSRRHFYPVFIERSLSTGTVRHELTTAEKSRDDKPRSERSTRSL
jgi:hypothetical protein